jgi:hypothetical protein
LEGQGALAAALRPKNLHDPAPGPSPTQGHICQEQQAQAEGTAGQAAGRGCQLAAQGWHKQTADIMALEWAGPCSCCTMGVTTGVTIVQKCDGNR